MEIAHTNDTIKPGTLYEILPDGRWAFYFDHHMISIFADCEAAFKLRFIDNVRPRGDMAFSTACGIWWAKVMEWYYTALSHNDLTRALAAELAISAWDEVGLDRFAQDKRADTFGGKAAGVSMVLQYFDATSSIDKQNWKIVAIEAGFGLNRETTIGQNDKVVVFYTGRPDLLVFENQRLVPVDHKTVEAIKKSTHSAYKPHAQTAGYIVAAQVLANRFGWVTVDRCIVNVAARNEPSDNPRDGVKKSRFLRVLEGYSTAELAEWRCQTVAKAMRLRYCIEHDEWLWNDKSCHRYSNGCEYLPIHSRPPEARPLVIQSAFSQGEIWSPYKVEPT